MAITQVGTATSATSTGGTNITVTKPTGVQSGDILLAFGCSNEGAWDTLPSGFTQFHVSTDADTANNFRSYAWYKVAGGSEPANYTFGSTTASGSGAPLVATIIAFRGADNVNVISHNSYVGTGTSAEPSNPATSFSQTDQGRLFFIRYARSTTAIPTFSNGTADWTEFIDVGEFSGGSVRYGIGGYLSDFDTGSGSRSEPAITCSTTETDNTFLLACLKAAPAGDVGATLAPVTSAFAGDHRINADMAATLAPVTSDMTGLGMPPSGTLDTALAPVTSSFAGTATGGPLAATLAPVSSSITGAVNPIGTITSSLAPVSASIVAETRPFGEHIIRVEHEGRAFRVPKDDGPLIPIKRSEVTDL